MAYVIKSWRASNKPDSKKNYVKIVGRRQGFISWVLSMIGIDPTMTITVSDARIEISNTSLAGSLRKLIPHQGVCSTFYGYQKPWQMTLVIFFLSSSFLSGGLAIAFGSDNKGLAVVGIFLGLLVGIVIALIYYFLNRTITLGFIEQSGVASRIDFKRSVIENQDIDEDQAAYICELVQYLVETRSKAASRP